MPAKLEGAAFGDDVMSTGENQFFVFGFTDQDLAITAGLVAQKIDRRVKFR